MVTENVQDTTKVQLDYKHNVEMPFSISWTKPTLLTYTNQSYTKKQQML